MANSPSAPSKLAENAKKSDRDDDDGVDDDEEIKKCTENANRRRCRRRICAKMRMFRERKSEAERKARDVANGNEQK